MEDELSNTADPRLSARAEERLHAVLDPWLRARGWTPKVVPYVGYGAEGWVRVLARVMFTSPLGRPDRDEGSRGWRHFLCASAAGIAVHVEAGDRSPSWPACATGPSTYAWPPISSRAGRACDSRRRAQSHGMRCHTHRRVMSF